MLPCKSHIAHIAWQCELGPGWNALVGDEVFHLFDLGKTLDCMPMDLVHPLSRIA